ncbi:hypothetical protein [Nocardioides sp. Leaf307]|uniref:hypothetical protein n=1 Tax=Nocardioides sp. Leaf307 TaxID=1736331 RepID=UPI0007026A13|nr:hypothetical protein [Nocardioides sp. Leaf307]KQQ39320.1 hypothetical protein ASF50_15195 [Nocardioides sp. Leaf307]
MLLSRSVRPARPSAARPARGPRRTPLLVAGLAVSALALVGCGSDDSESASDAASPAASSSAAAPDLGEAQGLCEALTSVDGLDTGSDVATFAEALGSAEVPSDAPSDAATGYDVYLEKLQEVDPDLTAEELAAEGDFQLSKQEKTQVAAFVGYVSQVCAGAAASEAPSESPSGSPSGSPAE